MDTFLNLSIFFSIVAYFFYLISPFVSNFLLLFLSYVFEIREIIITNESHIIELEKFHL